MPIEYTSAKLELSPPDADRRSTAGADRDELSSRLEQLDVADESDEEEWMPNKS